MTRPDVDVLLLGPTSVTGREIARHLGRRTTEVGLSWAVAGRDPGRIAAALERVGAVPAAVHQLDVTDGAAVRDLVEGAGAVINVVGPFARFGENVYGACAAAGTDLVDPSGELQVTREMIARFDDLATTTGARIVPTAGFESLPFDLGVLASAHALHQRTGDPIVDAFAVATARPPASARRLSDAVSGGTFVSMVDAIRSGHGPVFSDPHCLDTAPTVSPGRYDLRPRRSPFDGSWLSPMAPAAFINPGVVHRTASLLRDSGDSIFAPGFEYREGMIGAVPGPGALAGVAALVLSGVAAAMVGASRLPDGLRRRVADLLERVGPKAGDGPRPEDLDAWSFDVVVRATDAGGATQDVTVHGAGHPGYLATSKMLAEAGMALASPDSGLPDGAGFLTPATALGLAVIDPMEHAGLRFELRQG